MSKKKYDYTSFKIGDFVDIVKLVRRSGDGKGTATVNQCDIPNGKKLLKDGRKTRVGVVVGVKHMPLGTTEWDECCYFAQTGTQFVWRVRFSLAGREYQALSEDLSKCDPPDKFPVSSQRWSKADREMLSRYVEGEPRDEKGRF